MSERKAMCQMMTVMQVMLCIMWPITATAAQLSFSRSLYQSDVLLDLCLAMGISVLVGLSALLVAMKAEYLVNDKIDHLWLFVSSKMMCSITAGVGMYFAADMLQLARSGTVVAIILASFSGTVLLEKGAAGLIGWLARKVSA